MIFFVIGVLLITGIILSFVEEHKRSKALAARKAHIASIVLIEQAMDECQTSPELKAIIRSTYESTT